MKIEFCQRYKLLVLIGELIIWQRVSNSLPNSKHKICLFKGKKEYSLMSIYI